MFPETPDSALLGAQNLACQMCILMEPSNRGNSGYHQSPLTHLGQYCQNSKNVSTHRFQMHLDLFMQFFFLDIIYYSCFIRYIYILVYFSY